MKKRIYLSKKIFFVSLILVLSIALLFNSFASADTTQNVDVELSFYGPFWDVDYNGYTDYLDLSSLVYHYGEYVPITRPPRNWSADRWDITGDGVVNYLDLSVLVSHYNECWLDTGLDDANTQPSHTTFMGAVAEATAIASSIIVNSANISIPLITIFVFIGIIYKKKRRKKI